MIMVRTIARASLLGLAGTLMTMSLVVAQQPGTSGHMSSMGNMMQECRMHHQEMMTALDSTMTMMRKAQQSNDPAQMREALEQAQQALAAMKDHMGPCMNMMNMMGMMQGGMGSQMPQQKKE
jgi:hypothetical protein